MSEDDLRRARRGQISVCAEATGIQVRLSGDLDDATGLLLADAIAAAADSIGPSQRVDVDLRDVGRLTPAGVHALATSTSQAQARDRGVRVRFRRELADRVAALRLR